MRIPKFIVFGALALGAGFLGWLVHDYFEATDLRPAAASSKVPEAHPPPEAVRSDPVFRLRIIDAGEATEDAGKATESASGVREVTTVRQRTGGVIVAHDGSIVLVGDDGRLKANTGDVSKGGALAIDADRSTLTSGSSKPSAARSPEPAGPRGGAVPQHMAAAGREFSQARPSRPDLFGRSDDPRSGDPRSGTRGTAIAGFEDHSLDVTGEDNIVTYDDSNVFINRDGKINANTGDTDSSGLNVVDATRSTIRSGDHIEDGEEDGEEEEEEEEERAAGGTSAAPSDPAPSGTGTGTGTGGGDGTATRSGGDTRGGSATVADEGDASATGDEALAIGGDGYDDLAVDVAGKRNVATYDDSNVVQGGHGGANTQVGDSDTSGAVIMGSTDSTIESGDST